MSNANSEPKFAICLKNDNYLASLEVRKIYQVIFDVQAAKHQLIRVIDESGEDYLYPLNYFTLIELPEAAKAVFAITH